jgi:hypothetical protein
MIRKALRHQSQYLALAGTEPIYGTFTAWTVDHPPNHFRIKGGASAGGPAHCIDKGGDITHTVFEEVPHPFGPVAEEFKGVVRFEKLREDENRHSWLSGADLFDGTETVVGRRRRHLYIRHDHIGTVYLSLSNQLVGVGGHADNLEPGSLQDVNQTFALNGVVFTHDDADGCLIHQLVTIIQQRPGSNEPVKSGPTPLAPRPRPGVGSR